VAKIASLTRRISGVQMIPGTENRMGSQHHRQQVVKTQEEEEEEEEEEEKPPTRTETRAQVFHVFTRDKQKRKGAL
jgi:hypothetical protein